MKRRTTEVSESLQRKLNAYALAASAAGVGMLAMAQSAEAKIVYTPADKSIPPNHSFYLDLNHDGVDDFRFFLRSTGTFTTFSHTLTVERKAENAVQGDRCGSFRCAAALSKGISVGPKSPFVVHTALMFFSRAGYDWYSSFGPWLHLTKQAYLGLKLTINGKIHYGWARFRRIERAPTTVLTGYAYETIPNKPIITGKTKSEHDRGVEQTNPVDRGSDSFLISPIPDTQQPASLGTLAMGARGVSIWRRKEWALQGN